MSLTLKYLMTLIVVLLTIVSKSSQERVPHTRVRRDASYCLKGDASYRRLSDDIGGLQLKSKCTVLLSHILTKYLGNGKKLPNTTSDHILYVNSVKKLFTQIFPSGKTKPESLQEYYAMLKTLSTTVSVLSIELIAFDRKVSDDADNIKKIAKEGAMFYIKKSQMFLSKCKDYSSGTTSSFQPDDVLYTYNELNALFTDNKTSSGNLLRQKMLYTTLAAMVKVLNQLDSELKQRYKCL